MKTNAMPVSNKVSCGIGNYPDALLRLSQQHQPFCDWLLLGRYILLGDDGISNDERKDIKRTKEYQQFANMFFDLIQNIERNTLVINSETADILTGLAAFYVSLRCVVSYKKNVMIKAMQYNILLYNSIISAMKRNKIHSSIFAENIVAGCEIVLKATANDKKKTPEALDAGVDLLGKLMERVPGATPLGDAILRYIRDWQALGSIEDSWLEQKRDQALLRYVGIDDNYLSKYEEFKAWTNYHPDDNGAAKRLFFFAKPLVEVFCREKRYEDAAKVCVDIYNLHILSDTYKQAMFCLFYDSLTLDLSNAKCEINLALNALIIIFDKLKPADNFVSAHFAELKLWAAIGHIQARRSKDNASIIKDLPEPLPISEHAQNKIAWEIYRRCKLCIKTDPIMVIDMLELYAHLSEIEKPSLLHSMMLQYATRVGSSWTGFIKFMRTRDMATFRPEDFKTTVYGNRTYNSLVDNTIKCLYQTIKHQKWRIMESARPTVKAI